jgi:peptidoglycan/LPS O-acetylase OafA/YrhL
MKNRIFQFLFMIITTIKLVNNTTNPPENFFANNECERKTKIVLSHLLSNIPLPDELSDFHKTFYFSGSGINELGDYDSCMKLEGYRYYLLIVNPTPDFRTSQKIGFCYFKDCDINYMNNSKQQIIDFIQQYIKFKIDPKLVTLVDPQQELGKQRETYFTGAIIVISILMLLVLVNIIFCFIKFANKKDKIKSATVYERTASEKHLDGGNDKTEKDSKLYNALKIFDFIENAKKIIEIKKSNKVFTYLHIFDGVRVLSMCWVIHGHSFAFTPFKNMQNVFLLAKTWYLCIVMSGYFAVDVFFYMSGFMLCLSLQKFLGNKIPRVKIFLLAMLNRYLRLLPLLLFIIVGMTYLLPFMGSGPNSYFAQLMNRNCEKYFWHNLLYINNLMDYGMDGMCAGHTWYLANDMQFFFGSIILFIFLNNQKLVRNIIIFIIFIFSLGWQVYQAYINGYRYNDILHDSGKDFFSNYYIQPWARVTPYIVGLYFCELFMETRLYRQTLKKDDTNEIIFLRKVNDLLSRNNFVCFILFIFSLLLINFAVFITHWTLNYDIGIAYHAVILAFNKTLFVIGLGFIIHLTFLGKFNVIRSFLSLKSFTVISRMTYGAYLIHLYYMITIFFGTPGSYYLSFIEFIYLTCGFVTLSLFTSFILSLILESPVINLTKRLIDDKKS